MRKKNNELGEMLVLLLQIGISMIVPIALMTLLAYYIAIKTGVKWVSVILFIMGAAAGMRNVYKLVSKYLKKQKEPYEIAAEEKLKEDSVVNEAKAETVKDRQEEDNEKPS